MSNPEILIASAAPATILSTPPAVFPNGSAHANAGLNRANISLKQIAVLPEVQIRQDGLSQDLVRRYLAYYAQPVHDRHMPDGPQGNPTISAMADSITHGRDYGRLLVYRADSLDAATLTRLALPREAEYILAGGFSRFFALRLAGKEFAHAEVKRGTWADVLLPAGDHNMANGQPLTQDDLKEYGRRLFELTKFSQNQIAGLLGVSAPTVSRWKRDWAESHDRAASTANMGRPQEWATPEELVDELRAKLARRSSALISQLSEAKRLAAGDAHTVAALSKTITKRHTDDALIQAGQMVADVLGAEFDAIRATTPPPAPITLPAQGLVPMTVEQTRPVVRLVVERNSPYGLTSKITYLENQQAWEVYRRTIDTTKYTLTDSVLRQAIRDVIADLRREKMQAEAANPAAKSSNGHGPASTFVPAIDPDARPQLEEITIPTGEEGDAIVAAHITPLETDPAKLSRTRKAEIVLERLAIIRNALAAPVPGGESMGEWVGELTGLFSAWTKAQREITGAVDSLAGPLESLIASLSKAGEK